MLLEELMSIFLSPCLRHQAVYHMAVGYSKQYTISKRACQDIFSYELVHFYTYSFIFVHKKAKNVIFYQTEGPGRAALG